MYQRHCHRRPFPTDAHAGRREDFYARHAAEAADAARGPGAARDRFLAALFDRVTDTRMLLLAAEDVRRGGRAPGADGVSPADLDRADVLALARTLRDQLRCGRYRPGPVRVKPTPKRSGGTRTLSIPTVADRVVQRAVLRAVQPYLDPQLAPGTLGGRPGRSLGDAVALADRTAGATGSWCVATADVRTAFDAVPHDRLLAVLRDHFGSSPLYDLEFPTKSGQRLAVGLVVRPLVLVRGNVPQR